MTSHQVLSTSTSRDRLLRVRAGRLHHDSFRIHSASGLRHRSARLVACTNGLGDRYESCRAGGKQASWVPLWKS